MTATLLLLLACKPPEAPDTIEEMMVYGFTNLEDDEAILALADKLIPWMQDNRAELEEGYQVQDLSVEDLAAAGIEDAQVDGVIGAAVGLYYAFPVDDIAFGLTYPEQTEIFEKYLSYERLEETDRACFLDRSCPEHTCLNDVHIDFGAGIEGWNHWTQTLRRVDSEAWGELMVRRVLGPDPSEFSVDWLEVPQQHGFSFVYNEAGAAIRVQTVWVEGRIVGADVPETFALSLGMNGMRKSAEDLDAWLAENR